MTSIHFFVEDIKFKLANPKKISHWIKETISNEQRTLGVLNIVFCSDEYLLKINSEYLAHKTFTDIITFDNSEKAGVIEGDIFISIDRVKENALSYASGFENELSRVIIHGVLHLIGYSDKSARSKSEMRGKEDAYLSLLKK